jgi:hypothetical protein
MNANNKESFSQVGGARISLMNATFPFARLSMSQGMLQLAVLGLGQPYVFPRGKIVALAKHRWFFSTGLRIHHTVPSNPRFIVFWVGLFFCRRRFATLRARLEAFGYAVEG